MTPIEMKKIREAAGLTQLELAHLFRLRGKNSDRVIRRIESGDQAATGPISLLYELLYTRRLADYVNQIVAGRR